MTTSAEYLPLRWLLIDVTVVCACSTSSTSLKIEEGFTFYFQGAVIRKISDPTLARGRGLTGPEQSFPKLFNLSLRHRNQYTPTSL